MSRKCLTEKNARRIEISNRFAAKRAELKKKIYDKTISLEERYKYIVALSLMPRDSSRTRIRNRCNITGRPRGYYRQFGISRIMLRELAGKAEIPGLYKSSW